AVVEVGDLAAHDLDPLVGEEERSLTVVAGDADDEAIHQLHRAPDDVGMAIGDRVKGAGIDPYARRCHRSPASLCQQRPSARLSAGSSGAPLPSSSDSSGSRATDTTRSPSPTLKITTPWLRRRAMRMPPTGQRITMPPSVTSMTSSLSPTGKTATTASPSRRRRSMFSMPCPPRPVIR